jgi:FKBP-type peptidyl-prolyl cis-trans isomerase
MKYAILTILASIFIFQACETGDPYEKEKLAIQEYLTSHNLTVSPLASGLYYIEIKAGTGITPPYGATVKVKYTGSYTDGTIFDSGTFSFKLGFGQVITGMDEGIALMKEGGKATLIIPSDLAYRSNGSGDIPGYTPLVFAVELLDVF